MPGARFDWTTWGTKIRPFMIFKHTPQQHVLCTLEVGHYDRLLYEVVSVISPESKWMFWGLFHSTYRGPLTPFITSGKSSDAKPPWPMTLGFKMVDFPGCNLGTPVILWDFTLWQNPSSLAFWTDEVLNSNDRQDLHTQKGLEPEVSCSVWG